MYVYVQVDSVLDVCNIKYSQLALLWTPLGLPVSVLNNESP